MFLSSSSSSSFCLLLLYAPFSVYGEMDEMRDDFRCCCVKKNCFRVVTFSVGLHAQKSDFLVV